MKFEKTKFREDIHELKDEKTKVLNQGNGIDIDEIQDLSTCRLKIISQEIIDHMNEGNDMLEQGLSLFLAKKNIKFSEEYSQEINYKTFLLTNVIIAFSTLIKGGNFVIKIYDMFTPFTISILYILYNHFKKFTIVKPFSTRQHTNSRYVICSDFIEQKPEILEYLYEFFDRYVITLKSGLVKYFFIFYFLRIMNL